MGDRAWPDEVERVAAFLRAAGVEARVEEFRELGQIVKSLVFECDGQALVVMVPDDRRADRAKIGAAAGCAKAKIAGPERVVEATGFEPGAVAPFPLPQVGRVFIDRSLLQHRIVWVGAGSHSHMAAVAPPDLVRLARAEPMDVVEHHT